MTRCLAAAAGFFFLASSTSAQDDAEKLFQTTEKKIAGAKAQRIAFEAATGDPQEPFTLKGTLTLATGNRMRLIVEGRQGEKTSKVTWVSDGRTVSLVRELAGETSRTSDPTPDKLHEALTAAVARASITSALNIIPDPEGANATRRKLFAFKSSGRERVGERDTHVIEYQIETQPEGTTMTCKVWLNARDSLPVKRVLEVRRDGQTLFRAAETYGAWELDPPLPEGTFTLPK
jgi:outer membrane lipoprotein-sorting protein